MLAWSSRLSTPRARGDQVPRWYRAEMPNSSEAVRPYSAAAILALVVGAKPTSTIPPVTASGNVTACSQPRSLGLTTCISSVSSDIDHLPESRLPLRRLLVGKAFVTGYRREGIMSRPYRGRSVMAGKRSTRQPGAGRSVHSLARVASTNTASVQAKSEPTHTRRPAPNGRYAPRGWPGAASSKRGASPDCPPTSQRRGRNATGASHQRGSRCSTHGLSAPIAPAGTRYPPSVTGSSIRRLITQAGGYSRRLSATTARVYGSAGRSAKPGVPGSASTSACSAAAAVGDRASSSDAQDSAFAVVS